MQLITDEIKSKKSTRQYILTMLAITFLIIAVSTITIIGTSSSTAINSKSRNQSFSAAVSNNVANPPISINCEKPVLTLALILDRSGSVYSGDHQAPQKYKDTVNNFLTKLSNEITSRNGEVNVIVSAFGARSVLQNKKDNSGNLITSITDLTSLNDMKDTVNRIWFSQPTAQISDSNKDGVISPSERIGMERSSDVYDVVRGYNPGSDDEGFYSTTNWDDALLAVANIGNTKYSNPSPGKHIDLALMLTDGDPNMHNGTNRVFDSSDMSGWEKPEYKAAGREYATATVKELRLGTSTRPPMAVRGVLINSSDESATKQVFGEGSDNYSTSDNFDSDLDRVLDQVIDSIDTNELCQSIYVVPSISISYQPNVSINEGDTAKSINVVITNTSKAYKKNGEEIVGMVPNLTNVVWTHPGITEVIPVLDGIPVTKTLLANAPYGTSSYNIPLSVKASFVDSGKLKLRDGFSRDVSAVGTIDVNVKPAAFPS